jgi:CheY-like chemotaxis protein
MLLAEDNPVNVEVARPCSKPGLDVSRAHNGEEALHSVQADDFDLILMDCQMPVMDGFAATAEIRRHEQQRGRARAAHHRHHGQRCRATANPAWPPAWTTT